MKMIRIILVAGTCLLGSSYVQAGVLYRISTAQSAGANGYDASMVSVTNAADISGPTATEFGNSGEGLGRFWNSEPWSGSATGGGFDLGADNQSGFAVVTNSFSTGYQEYTIAADAGKTMDLTSLDFGIARGGTSETRGYVLYAAVDGEPFDPADYIARVDNLPTSALRSAPLATSVDLSAAAFQGISSVTFRWYPMSPKSGNTVGYDALTLYGAFDDYLSAYTNDAHTVYLFHLDETAGSGTAAWEGSGAGSGAYTVDASADEVTDVLGAAGLFGGAADMMGAWSERGIGIDVDTPSDGFEYGDEINFNTIISNGQFTLEALVKPAVSDLTDHGQIWCMDSGDGSRGFQFRLNSSEQLEWNPINLGGDAVSISVGTLRTNSWYHAAITYSDGDYTMYWTPADGSNTQAQVLHTWNSPLTTTSLSAELMLGNEGRYLSGTGSTEAFPGLIDEARISNVARSSVDFVFRYTDADRDGMSDEWEQQIIDADPDDAIEDINDVLPGDNFDGDALTNLEEYEFGTDPTTANDPDNLDGDDLPDAWELTYFESLWTQDGSEDPDNDGFTNLEEYQNGTDPTIFSDPNDVDGDGLPDAWETLYIGSLSEDGSDDHDGDGFTNAEEFAAGTLPGDTASVPGDSDADGLNDDWEYAHFGDLTQSGTDDPDGDAYDNSSEQAADTDPNLGVAYPGTVDSTTPTGLMVDLLAHPHRTTIPDTEPEFTWIFHPAARGDLQTAYQIIVSSSAALARAGTGDVWDSGKVTSAESVDVEYAAGSELTRGGGYFWRVRTWGEDDIASDWSFVQSFSIESSSPQTGARSIHLASDADSSGFDWAGRYQPEFNTAAAPTKVLDKGDGNFYIDFGRDAFGYITLRMNGNFAGQSMEVRFGEKSTGMSVDTEPGSTIRYSSTTQSLSDGDVTYEIRPPATSFNVNYDPLDITGWAGDVTPFRYIELINCPASITASDIRQWILHIPFDDDAAGFSSSNDTLNQVWELCRYSMKATSFCGAYVDGDRERTPYEADAYINQLSHYAVDREYTLARYTYEFLLDNSTWPTEWKMHFPLMAWADYMHTGNLEALAVNYAKILEHIDQYTDGLSGGLLNTEGEEDIVDWPTSERDSYSFSDVNTVVNAFNYKSWVLLAEMASVLGKSSDLDTFTNRVAEIESAFNTAFWNGAQYQDGETAAHVSAHANFFPMAMGLVPTGRVDSVMTFLKTKRMAPSVYGAQYLLEALFEGGEADYAIGLMADDDPDYKRHWYNMLLEGATITMEAWDNDYKSNTDWNHAWGAAPGNIIPRYVLGLKPLTAGFGEAEIKPQLGSGDGTNGLSRASGTIPTIRGTFRIDVDNAPTNFYMTVEIPGNVTAAVSIPSKGYASPAVLYDGTVVEVPVTDGRLVIENVPGGVHSFWLSETAAPDAAVLKANWKAAMFGQDADDPAVAGDELDGDGDGATTEEEFVANTDPGDASDRWTPVVFLNVPAGPVESVFSGKSGRRYTLERTPSLVPASWTDIDWEVLSEDSVVELSDSSLMTSNAFYRTRVELP